MNIKKLINDAIIRILRAMGKIDRSQKDYPAGLKYERKESFKKQIDDINKKKGA